MIIGLIYIGMLIQMWRTPQRHPANQQCKTYAEQSVVRLKAEIDSIFGTEIPEGTISKKEIKSLGEQCSENINKYEYIVPEGKV